MKRKNQLRRGMREFSRVTVMFYIWIGVSVTRVHVFVNINSKKWKWSLSVVSDSLQPHGLQPTRLLCPWNSPGKNTVVGSFLFSRVSFQPRDRTQLSCIADRFFTVWATKEAMLTCIVLSLYVLTCLILPKKFVSVYCHLTHEKQGLEQTCQLLRFTKLLSNCDKA